MREFLFRGKRTDNGEWVYGYYTKARYFLDNKEMHIIFEPDAEAFPHCEFPWYEEVLPETVGEYTGLTDKNGRKIFEGDIIRYADVYEYNCYLESLEYPEEYDGVDFSDMWTVDEVVYCIANGYPAFDLSKHDFDTNGLSALDESRQFYFEVIGNIYDNPELLEGGNDNG